MRNAAPARRKSYLKNKKRRTEAIFQLFQIPKKDDFKRYVSAYGYQLKNSNCTPTTKTQINGFNFRPEVRGTYTFKFWNGKDANNNNVWIEKTIVVK